MEGGEGRVIYLVAMAAAAAVAIFSAYAVALVIVLFGGKDNTGGMP